MLKRRIAYIVSLVILVVLIGFTGLSSIATGEKYSEVSREHLLRTEDAYIIEFDLINHEGKDTNYTINVLIDGKQYSLDVPIQDGRIFTYIRHVYLDMITERTVSFAIYKEGEELPFEEITYYLN